MKRMNHCRSQHHHHHRHQQAKLKLFLEPGPRAFRPYQLTSNILYLWLKMPWDQYPMPNVAWRSRRLSSLLRLQLSDENLQVYLRQSSRLVLRILVGQKSPELAWVIWHESPPLLAPSHLSSHSQLGHLSRSKHESSKLLTYLKYRELSTMKTIMQ